MTTIRAEPILGSISPEGVKIATPQLRYPRFIHAELLVHRAFSRNASSSRATPVRRLIADIRRDPATPLHWGRTQPGMQAHAEVGDDVKAAARAAWTQARENAIRTALELADLGVHKQIVNRPLEPFSHINVVLTATDFDNFFALRDHPDAEPHIQILAREMRRAVEKMDYQMLAYGEWHAPYTDGKSPDHAKQSVAYCARVSYLDHDGLKPSLEQNLALYERLMGSEPRHASPAEHQATPLYRTMRSRNFQGWLQWRAFVEGGCA